MDPYSSQIIINSHLDEMRAEGARSRAARTARRTAARMSLPTRFAALASRVAQPTHRDRSAAPVRRPAVLAARLTALAMIGDVTRRVTSPEFIGRTDELELLRRCARGDGRWARLAHPDRGRGGRRQVAPDRRGRRDGSRSPAGRCSSAAAWTWAKAGCRSVRTRTCCARGCATSAGPRRSRSPGRPPRTWAGWCRSCDPGTPRRPRIAGCRRASTTPCSTCSRVSRGARPCWWCSRTCTGRMRTPWPPRRPSCEPIRSERVSLLMTYRSDELHRRHPLRSLAGRDDSLHPPDTPGPGALRRCARSPVSSRASWAPSPVTELVESLHRRSDGNPFFAEELLACGLTDGGQGLSPTLRDLLATRIAGVSEPARTVLGIVAVARTRPEPHAAADHRTRPARGPARRAAGGHRGRAAGDRDSRR